MRNLRSFNLNLLPILRELLRKRNVSRAAIALNMSQSSVSEALGRLRLIFDDEILVREGREFRPTMMAERIEGIVEQALGEIEALLCNLDFDPSLATGSIRIATADYVALVFGVRLAEAISASASELAIEFLDVRLHSPKDLESDQLDFIIAPRSPSLKNFQLLPLFEDRAVCIVGANSQFASGVTVKNFWRARHAVYAPGGSLPSSINSVVMDNLGREKFNAVIVESFAVLPFIVEASDMIALVPELLAQRVAAMANIKLFDLPFAFPKIEICAAWHDRKRHDPRHRWIREALVNIKDAALFAPSVTPTCERRATTSSGGKRQSESSSQ